MQTPERRPNWPGDRSSACRKRCSCLRRPSHRRCRQSLGGRETEGRPVSIPRNGTVQAAGSLRSKVARPRSANPAPTARGVERAVASPNDPRPEAPIVRVTIGRIEVRALAGADYAERKTAPRSAPKLTLDAYLKARKEGAR